MKNINKKNLIQYEKKHIKTYKFSVYSSKLYIYKKILNKFYLINIKIN